MPDYDGKIGLDEVAPAVFKDSSRHGVRLPRGDKCPNAACQLWQGGLLRHHGVRLNLMRMGIPEERNVRYVLCLFISTPMRGSRGMQDGSPLLLQTANHFSSNKWARIKRSGPPNFDWSGHYHALLKSDPTLPDLLPMRKDGVKKSFLQWIYLLDEVVKHISDPQSPLPLTCTSDDSTVLSEQMPYGLAFQICQYLSASLWAKAPAFAPVLKAFMQLEPGIILHPTKLTTAALEVSFVFRHVGRMALADNNIKAIEEEDKQLSAPFEKLRDVNYNQLKKWPKCVFKLEPHSVLKQYGKDKRKKAKLTKKVMQEAEKTIGLKYPYDQAPDAARLIKFIIGIRHFYSECTSIVVMCHNKDQDQPGMEWLLCAVEKVLIRCQIRFDEPDVRDNFYNETGETWGLFYLDQKNHTRMD